MNLTLAKLKMNIGEHPNRAEGLRDASHLKHGRFSHFICGRHLMGGARDYLFVLLGFTSSARKAPRNGNELPMLARIFVFDLLQKEAENNPFLLCDSLISRAWSLQG
jgi:hypothetical protein